jgi:hypothetical protein
MLDKDSLNILELGTPIIIANGGFSNSKIFNYILNINKCDTYGQTSISLRRKKL